MKRRLFAVLIVAVVVTFAGYNIYQSLEIEPISKLMLANVEAIAQGESAGTIVQFPQYRLSSKRPFPFVG